ncbi:MAG: 4-hydroxythreonine-4-phosphate dehydrogenase 2 [Firmicutes bacterium ADurb.Bin419]|nr:MAG: 4-hydroxythreonine-4-phosphate dehydrogenase 2 [Firmicutes bacterium ADurb.Bin419]
MKKPVVGITIGDPAGIGPEIVIKALLDIDVKEQLCPVVIGSARVLESESARLQSDVTINKIQYPWQGRFDRGYINIIDIDNVDLKSLCLGKMQPDVGMAALEYLEKSFDMAKEGKIGSVATAPVNKQAVNAASKGFVGHTEKLAEMTKTEPLTMFEVRNLRVFFLSRHVSLKKACELVTFENVLNCIQHCDKALQSLGLKKRSIAVSGLNPHNGDNGMFGDEEIKEIQPAVERARSQGIDAEGPISADSVFFLALQGKYDAVIALYHDAGHIATKMVDFNRSISITIGLPFIRTSVNHGTAYDIAGQGIASAVSMKEAILAAAGYSTMYKGFGN